MFELSKLKMGLPVLMVVAAAASAYGQNYTLTTLTTDGFTMSPNTDGNLVNAWGISRSSGSPWWVSDNGTGKSTLYDSTGAAIPLVVTIPSAQPGGVGSPTGTIFNGTFSFRIGGQPARFLFATEDGTVSGWVPSAGNTAQIAIKKFNAVYKGLTAATFQGHERLYVTNFRTARVEVYDSNFKPVPMDEDAFELPDDDDLVGYAPFNIQNQGNTLFVTYAVQNAEKHDNLAGPGLGRVASFTLEGKLITVFDKNPNLNAPWGLALAPTDFGAYSHALLVGNFGNGWITAYNAVDGHYMGLLLDPTGAPIWVDGLWGISFGNDGGAGPYNTLYVAAGPVGETHGFLGSLKPVDSTQVKGNDL